jgi:hypothetical protein
MFEVGCQLLNNNFFLSTLVSNEGRSSMVLTPT